VRGTGTNAARNEEITGSAQAVYRRYRMWEAYADQAGWMIKVFRDPAVADKWLKDQLEGCTSPCKCM